MVIFWESVELLVGLIIEETVCLWVGSCKVEGVIE
jgi:hypothetical protein